MSKYGTALCNALLALTNCVCETLKTEGTGAVCWCGLYPSEEPPADYCDSCDDEHCGMAWVRVVTAFPSDAFPTPNVDLSCAAPLAYMLEVGVTRCMPTVEEDGTLPGDTDVTEAAVKSMVDMLALHQAITCCSDANFERVAVEAWTPTGPEGGCGGGFWTVYVAIR